MKLERRPFVDRFAERNFSDLPVSRIAAGPALVYWVWFDEPQTDLDGDGPYRGGSVDEAALKIVN